MLAIQSCPTLWDAMDCSPPGGTPWTVWTVARQAAGSSVHGILQARILDWVAIFLSKGSTRLRDRTQVS